MAVMDQSSSQQPTEPSRSDGVVDNVTRELAGLSQSEGRIGAYLLEDPAAFACNSVRDIAAHIGVSEPSVLRFCRNVGYDGFKDLKFQLIQEVAVQQAQSDAADMPAQPTTTSAGSAMVDRCRDGAVTAINNVLGSLKHDEIVSAAQAITKASRVLIFGLGGSSSAMAMELHSRLFRLGVTTVPCSDSYLQRMSAATLNEGDVAIFLSATGRPQALLDCVELAKYYAATCVGILPSDSLLAREVDICVHIELSQQGVHPFQPNPMRYGQLFAIDVLSIEVAQALGDKARYYLDRTRASVALLNGVAAQQPIGD